MKQAFLQVNEQARGLWLCHPVYLFTFCFIWKYTTINKISHDKAYVCSKHLSPAKVVIHRTLGVISLQELGLSPKWWERCLGAQGQCPAAARRGGGQENWWEKCHCWVGCRDTSKTHWLLLVGREIPIPEPPPWALLVQNHR